jgi:uncharacterized protein with HEPN domain
MRSDAERLVDILAAAEAAVRFARPRSGFHADEDMLLAALTYQLIVIGEVSRAISDETRAKFPTLPWHQMVGMRNRVVHAYWSVASENVRGTVETDLPGLITQLRNALDLHSST